MAACPPLEDIAAFLDGITLSPEERARITEHLAHCESCYEIFAGAVHFSADDIGGRDVLPFRPLDQESIQETPVRIEPVRPPRRVPRWAALAASVVLVAPLGFMVWQSSRALPEVAADELTEPLRNQPGLIAHRYQPDDVMRGDDEEAVGITSTSPPFLVGVYLVDLRLTTKAEEVKAEEVKTTEEILYSLYGELDQILGYPEAESFKEEAGRMSSPAALRRFEATLPHREKALQNWFAEDPFFRFGLWTEAGRLSAVAQSPKFFEQRVNRRFLSAIPREIRLEDDERYGPILDDLQKIEPLWEHSSRDYDALALHFGNIIDQFERIQKDDQEELALPSEP